MTQPTVAAETRPSGAAEGTSVGFPMMLLLWILVAQACGLILWFDMSRPDGVLFIGGDRFGVSLTRIGPLAAMFLAALAFALALRILRLNSRLAGWAHDVSIHWRRLSALIIGMGFTVALITVWVLRAFPNSGDEYDYLFQARTFLAGRLWNPLPPLSELFATIHVSFVGSKWVTLYPPGWSLLLAMVMELRLPSWLACPLASGVLLFAVLKLGERRDGPLGAVLAAGIVALSPFFIFNAGSYFNHVPAAAAGLLFVWAALSFLDQPRWQAAALAGVALGALGLIRPVNVPIFALPFLVEFCRRAGRRHYRLMPALLLAGLPFLAALLFFYVAIDGSLLPAIGRENPHVEFGLSSADEAGHPVLLLDKLAMALTRILMLAEWTSPVLVIGFFAGFVWLAAKRRLSFVDFIFPTLVVAFLLVPFGGGNQYGPRYYFEGFPFLVLTLVSALVALLKDGARPQRAAFAWSLVMAHGATCIAAAAIIGFCMRMAVDQRMDLYDRVEAAGLHDAVVVVHSGTGVFAPMEPGDLTRNGVSLDGPVIYALDIPDRLKELQRVMPARTIYVYERQPSSPAGSLRQWGP